jgi:D-glycero-alpha-D-manno-heptose-7-phosphate kinase
MLIRAKAPLRISFAGGGTDVPPFPEQEGGCVLSTTINRYAWGTLRPREDDQICINSLDFGLSLTYSTRRRLVYNGELDLAKAAIGKLAGSRRKGFDLFLHSDAPPGSGLGSSSAMMVVLVGLLTRYRNLTLTEYEIAELAFTIERIELGIQGGMQDHYAATFGGFNFIEFLADRVIVNGLKIARDVANELEYNLLVCDTGKVRLSANIIADQVERYERRDEDTLDALRCLKALTLEMKSALLRRKLNEFGQLLHEEWQQKKRMSSRISGPELDDLYAVALGAGAIGGKIAGAGGGGYMILYCPFDQKHLIADAMRRSGCAVHEIALEHEGLQTWMVPE